MNSSFVAIQQSISAQREKMRSARLYNAKTPDLTQFSTVIGHHPTLKAVGGGTVAGGKPADEKKPDGGDADQGKGKTTTEPVKGKGGKKGGAK